MALRRFNVQLFGAPWCEKCKQQKQMLYRMIGPAHWRDHYSDCGAAKCCLGCAGMKQVPMWKVNGRRYPGRFDVTQLAGIVGSQRPSQRGGRQATESRAAEAASRGDILGGLLPGQIPIGGRNRRHTRRAGWAKRTAVKIALGQNKGRYWCEFGELMTPRMAAAFGAQQGEGPSRGNIEGVGGKGDINDGSNGAGSMPSSEGVRHRDRSVIGAPGVDESYPHQNPGAAETTPTTTVEGGGYKSYKKAGWIPPDNHSPGSGASNAPPPMGSLVLTLTSLSLRP